MHRAHRSLRQQRFNPRARAGRDASSLISKFHGLLRFNPRARAGRDSAERLLDATCCSGFNPRARAGRDRPSLRDVMSCQRVSIHAPARGATYSSTFYASA